MNEQVQYLPKEGDKIGAGLVLNLISAGGTGHVYKTWVESLELHRAVKVMNPDAGPEIRARFATEARISSKLVHHNIVHVYNFGETPTGLPYIEMELVSGMTLESVLRQREELPLPVALAVTMGVLDALHYAHTINFTLYDQPVHGIMHRDIKPANVIFSGGVPKLMDFGIARPVAVSMHTMTGTMPGTMAYMAPELYVSGTSDFRSDIYQVGLLLYECISGRIPYPQTEIAPLIEAIKTGTRRPLDTNAKAAAIVKKCLELDPADRYQTVHECLAAIRALYAELSPTVPPEERIQTFLAGAGTEHVAPKKKRMDRGVKVKAVNIAIILTVCAALGIAVYGLLSKDRGSKEGGMTAETETSAVQSTVSADMTRDTTAAITDDNTLSIVQDAADTHLTKSMSSNNTTETGTGKHPAAPSSKKPLATPSSKQPVPPSSKQAAAPKPPAAPSPSEDDARVLLDRGTNLLAQNRPQEALSTFQRAIRMQSVTMSKQEIVRQSLYGTARANTALYRQGSVSRANYERAWQAVRGNFAEGSPEHWEAVNRLNEGGQ